VADSPDALLDRLRHPERRLIDALRRRIAAAAPRATESVKWNAPSFGMSEHFATLNLRAKRGIQLVLHLGARPRTDLDMRQLVDAPAGLLDWKGPDRAVVAIIDAAHLKRIGPALSKVVKRWAKEA
jgi:hypothetical protein